MPPITFFWDRNAADIMRKSGTTKVGYICTTPRNSAICEFRTEIDSKP